MGPLGDALCFASGNLRRQGKIHLHSGGSAVNSAPNMKKTIAILVLAAFAFVPALPAADEAPSKDKKAPCTEKCPASKDQCPASKGCCEKGKDAKKECPAEKEKKCPASK